MAPIETCGRKQEHATVASNEADKAGPQGGEPVSRRAFLGGTVAAAAAGIAAPYVIPSGVLAAPGRPGPNDKINIGIIGLNGQGRYNMDNLLKEPDTEIVAICEVFKQRRDAAIARAKAATTQPKDTPRHSAVPTGYNDYREVLARKDIDAVVIATTPHWHCRMAVDAAEAGKDFYCEKPMTLYPAETLAVKRAVDKHKVITQIGTQVHATPNYHRIVDVIRSGVLGKICVGRCFHVFNDGKAGIGHHPPTPPPEGLDWDLWLGPAPQREFHPKLFQSSYTHPSFMAYSGGWTPGMAPHVIDIPFWALELGCPLAASSSGGRYLVEDDGDAYDFHEVVWQFPKFTLTWTSSLINSYGFDLEGDQGCHRRRGIYLQGVNGTLIGDYEYLKVVREACFLHNFDLEKIPKVIPDSPGHHRDWLDGIRSRKQPPCHVGYHYHIDMAITLSLLSLKLGRTVRFDPATETIPNDPEASKLAVPTYRDPWKFPEQYLEA